MPYKMKNIILLNMKYHFVKYVEGSINNVIGFPLEEIKKDLIKHHLI